MPGFYADGEYDIAGFIVGIVDRARIVDGRTIAAGDVLIGLPSAGLHTNGYSLARRVLFDVAGCTPATFVPELGSTVGDALLAPHRSYANAARPLLAAGLVRGMAHITGGGLTENVPRTLPEGCGVEINRAAWIVPPLFEVLQRRGGISDAEMFRAFNMGIGLVLVCAQPDVDRVMRLIAGTGEANAVPIGRVVRGSGVSYVSS
jgi:phosphoribosylformylglycinamidine cyclo-ligase